jgi:hypothetical protein
MDLLAQPFDTITFQDVVDFCDQKIVENTVLDYKLVTPNGLAKHFAAMSNRYGGLIIVGVEEDSQTGKPSRYEGIADDGKEIDRVHQLANNVRPLPTYDVRATDAVNGKVFLLIRINEGGAPPYTQVNDPTVYLRTGNITTPLRQADAEIVRELYAKRSNGESARRANVDRSKAVLLSVLELADSQQQRQALYTLDEADTWRFLPNGLDDNFRMLTAYLQPFYPGRELARPCEIKAALDRIRVCNRVDSGQAFPARDGLKPMARGLYSFHWMSSEDVSFFAGQVHATGFFSQSEQYGNAIGRAEAECICMADIARMLYMTLLFGRKLYKHLGYSGLAGGAVELTGAKGRPVRPNLLPQQYWPEHPLAIEAAYHWPIEADTHQLGSDDWVQKYFYETMREIYWDLGFENVSDGMFDEFLKEYQFL